ncbi:MAG TPA: DUF4342 domain-containing protein [Gemmatimonadaceae bacterium]
MRKRRSPHTGACTPAEEQGQTLIEIPLTMGIVGAVMLPVWVALGAIAALANHFTLEVVTRE